MYVTEVQKCALPIWAGGGGRPRGEDALVLRRPAVRDHSQCERRARRRLRAFFFQAEDGIRDGRVTGVQTCALPILVRPLLDIARGLGAPLLATNDSHYTHKDDAEAHDALLCVQTGALKTDANRFKFDEIGRASCRERGEKSRAGADEEAEGSKRHAT